MDTLKNFYNACEMKKGDSKELTVNGKNSEYTFYTFDPSVNVMVDKRIALLVSTTYTNKDVTGSFSTTITMKVETTT